jgi:trimeric autotransporter adhesin
MKTNIISDALPPIESKSIVPRFLIAVALVSFALPPVALAVVPAPDGGYPGGNTAEGQNALFGLTTGGFNTAVGYLSLKGNTDASFNTGVGAATLLANAASENTATGVGALLSNTVGDRNTANGAFALLNNSQGVRNTAVGDRTLINNTEGSYNTAFGEGAGDAITTGSNNTCIGRYAGTAITTANNVICIGEGMGGADVSGSCYIASIIGASVDPSTASTVYIDINQKLGTNASSRCFKHDIKPMDKASEAILALKPVSFHYNSDAKNTPCFGLIAEEVAEVNPDLVIRDKERKPYTVRYDQVNAMLLNEFLKEHRKVEKQGRKEQEQERAITQLKSITAKQEATIAQLESTVSQQQKAMQAVTARLEKQASEIEKVSDQLKASKFAPRTAGEVAVADQR